MPVTLIPIRGDSVIVPLAHGYIPGKIRWIECVVWGPDYLPQVVRRAFLHLRVRAVFTGHELKKFRTYPEGTMIAFMEDVADAMKAAGHIEAADHLMLLIVNHPHEVFPFTPGSYRLLASSLPC